MSTYELAERHLSAALAEAASVSTAEADVASALIELAVAVLQKTRSKDDIASELRFIVENLDEQMHHFIRP